MVESAAILLESLQEVQSAPTVGFHSTDRLIMDDMQETGMLGDLTFSRAKVEPK